MKKSIIILTAITSLFLFACNGTQTEISKTETTEQDSTLFKSPKENISIDEAFELSKAGALILDVREANELAELAYDVDQIKHIPLGELESRLAEVPKDKQVIVVCRSGGRSARANDLLRSKGFENTSNMEGGMNAWSEKGLPTLANGEKKACCANPDSENCNPDGSCKPTTTKK